jgi:hypothetical protein
VRSELESREGGKKCGFTGQVIVLTNESEQIGGCSLGYRKSPSPDHLVSKLVSERARFTGYPGKATGGGEPKGRRRETAHRWASWMGPVSRFAVSFVPRGSQREASSKSQRTALGVKQICTLVTIRTTSAAAAPSDTTRPGRAQRRGGVSCPCFYLKRGASVAMHRSHGLARWATHSLSVGKVLTVTHPDKGAAGATCVA